MILSQLFLAYSDLGLFLAVIGVYVFFAALWLIYVVTERSERRIKREIEDSVVEFSHSHQQAAGDHVVFEEDIAAYGQEISDLRSELTAVREVAMASGDRLKAMQAEIDSLRNEFVAHLDGLHSDQPADGDIAIEMTRVTVSDEPVVSARPDLRLYNPLVESVPAAETNETAGEENTSFDPERGLVYTSAPSETDNLTRIWGVGAVNQELLNENGIYFFEQVAEWTEEHICKFNDILCFRGRIEREDWVGQAKRLVQMKQHESRAA